MLALCREIAAAPITPLTVQFPYRRPADVREYARFYRAPLAFGALATAFLLRPDDLARPVVASDATLTGYLAPLAAQRLAVLGGQDTLRDRVRQVLWAALSAGVPALEGVGRGLGMSPRTLQRRLRAEGTTLSAVLTQLRHDLAPAPPARRPAGRGRGGVPAGRRGPERLPPGVSAVVEALPARLSPRRGIGRVSSATRTVSPATLVRPRGRRYPYVTSRVCGQVERRSTAPIRIKLAQTQQFLEADRRVPCTSGLNGAVSEP